MRTAAVALALSALTGLAAPAVGLACSYDPDGAEVPAFVPANGALHFQLNCHFDASFCQMPDNLELVDSQGNAVPGRIVLRYDSDRAGYFRPDAAFVENETYTILNLPKPDAVDADDHLTFGVNSPISLSIAKVTVKAELRTNWVGAGDSFSCATRQLCDEGTQHYDIYLQRRGQPMLGLTLSGLPWIWDSNSPRQHAMRVRFLDGESVLAEEPFSVSSDAGFMFPKTLAAYCYEVTVRSLEDDSEKVLEGCLPHGDLVTDVTEDVPESELVQNISYCAKPEDSEEALALWCDAQRKCNTISPNICPDVPEECVVAEAPGPEDDATDPTQESRPKRASSGCSLHADAAPDAGPLFLTMLGFGAWFMRGRRRALDKRFSA